MTQAYYIHDPDAKLDYGHNWSEWLDGDIIVASTWTAPDGITLVADDYTDSTTTVWLSGGIEGVLYKAVNHIVTAAGREDDRTIKIKVRQR